MLVEPGAYIVFFAMLPVVDMRLRVLCGANRMNNFPLSKLMHCRCGRMRVISVLCQDGQGDNAKQKGDGGETYDK